MWPFATHSQSNQKANAKAQPKSSRKKLWQKEETPPPPTRQESGVRGGPKGMRKGWGVLALRP